MTDAKHTKRERIIEAAISLWREAHSVNKVSLSEIALKARVSPTTLYNNFGNREGLVHAVIKYLTRQTLDRQLAIMKSELPLPQKIQSMISIKMGTMRGIQPDLLTKFASDPATKDYLDEVFQQEVKPMMMEIIEEGKRQGYIHPDLPAEVVMLYLDILKAGGIAYAEELQKVATDKRLLAGLARLFYYGLLQKDFDINIDANAAKEEK